MKKNLNVTSATAITVADLVGTAVLEELSSAIKAEENARAEIPTWEEISAARAAGGADYPSVFWATDATLEVKIGDEASRLTPDEALTKYGANPDFVREFNFLMAPRPRLQGGFKAKDVKKGR